MGFPGSLAGKESACDTGDLGLGRLPWRMEQLPTPVFLPAEFHGQRSLVGYTVRGVPKSRTWAIFTSH